MSTPPELGAEGRAFFHRLPIWIVGLATAAAGLALLWSGADLALGIALGALFGYANLRLLGRSVLAMLSGSRSSPPSPPASEAADDPEDILDFSQSPANPRNSENEADSAGTTGAGGRILRLPLLALAMLLILWYMPARPEGFLLGLVLSLLAAIGAALQAPRR